MRIKNIDLHKIQHAAVLGEIGNFAEAAERLHITQSALTRSIQALETSIGLRLFDRDRSGTRLTAAGLAYMNQARKLLSDARALEQFTSELAGGKAGEIRLGLGPLVAALILPDLFVRHLTEQPQVHMGIMISSAEVLNDEALADRLDLFVTGAGFAAPGCVSASSRLGRVRGSLVARKGHPLAGSKITSADLKEYPLVGGRTARSLQEYVADLGDLSIVCDDFRALIALTLESDALFVSTPSLVSQEIAAGELVELTITDWSPPSMDFGIFSVAKRTLSPTALRTITILRSTFSEIGLGQSA